MESVRIKATTVKDKEITGEMYSLLEMILQPFVKRVTNLFFFFILLIFFFSLYLSFSLSSSFPLPPSHFFFQMSIELMIIHIETADTAVREGIPLPTLPSLPLSSLISFFFLFLFLFLLFLFFFFSFFFFFFFSFFRFLGASKAMSKVLCALVQPALISAIRRNSTKYGYSFCPFFSLSFFLFFSFF